MENEDSKTPRRIDWALLGEVTLQAISLTGNVIMALAIVGVTLLVITLFLFFVWLLFLQLSEWARVAALLPLLGTFAFFWFAAYKEHSNDDEQST